MINFHFCRVFFLFVLMLSLNQLNLFIPRLYSEAEMPHLSSLSLGVAAGKWAALNWKNSSKYRSGVAMYVEEKSYHT